MAIEAEISATDTSAAEAAFVIERPSFDTAGATARFSYRLGDLRFTEALRFPAPSDAAAARTPAFEKLLGLTALVLGVSYFKLKAPLSQDDQVTYSDGTRATVDQMAKDVAAFLVWTAEPTLQRRHSAGLAVILFLLLGTGLAYGAYLTVWRGVKH